MSHWGEFMVTLEQITKMNYKHCTYPTIDDIKCENKPTNFYSWYGEPRLDNIIACCDEHEILMKKIRLYLGRKVSLDEILVLEVMES